MKLRFALVIGGAIQSRHRTPDLAFAALERWTKHNTEPAKIRDLPTHTNMIEYCTGKELLTHRRTA